jgi:hypothetical protein
VLENYFDQIMKILPYVCTTSCEVELYDEGIDEDGAQKRLPKKKLFCHFQSKHLRTNGDKSVNTSTSGECYFCGDIATELKRLVGGKITLFDECYEMDIEKIRDFHGKVIYTKATLK